MKMDPGPELPRVCPGSNPFASTSWDECGECDLTGLDPVGKGHPYFIHLAEVWTQGQVVVECA